MRFRDLLVVLVTEGENAQCKLEAVGTGTTVQASEPLDVLDFGTCLFLSLQLYLWIPRHRRKNKLF
jgi:hypothetical protein